MRSGARVRRSGRAGPPGSAARSVGRRRRATLRRCGGTAAATGSSGRCTEA